MNPEAEALKARTKRFALAVLDFVETLPTHGPAVRIGNQLTDSATSTAANYRAACRSRSRAEFAAKFGVVLEETDESLFWLELQRRELTACGLAYEDLVAASDVVVTKPGYGIVSECIANDVPLLYTSRGRFADYDVMVAEMPRVLRSRYISQDDLIAGRWREPVEALVKQPLPSERPSTNGADVAAEEILQVLL